MPPLSVLAPESALGSVPTVALSSAQAIVIIGFQSPTQSWYLRQPSARETEEPQNQDRFLATNGSAAVVFKKRDQRRSVNDQEPA